MSAAPAWPWFAIAGLGIFHALNPAMGWLFAVALGLHRHSRRVVLVSLLPMVVGHALSVWVVVTAGIAVGGLIDTVAIHLATGTLLLLWAAYHLLYGHRHRVRVGMTVGMAGLTLWSFVMATAHGAGLMLVPALLPLCAGMPAVGTQSLLLSLQVVTLHTLATLAVTGLIALVVYNWVGLAILRRGWINFDLLWTTALVTTGLLLIVTA